MLKKLNKMVLMTALLITLFMCVFNSTEVKAESYNNGVYETTIDGKSLLIIQWKVDLVNIPKLL